MGVINEVWANEILKQTFTPEEYVDREEQKGLMEQWCDSIIGNPLLISPQAGTGKTSFIKWFSKNVLSYHTYFKNVETIYISCKDTISNFVTIKAIAREMAMRQGEKIKESPSTYDYLMYIYNTFENSSKGWFIILDEVDTLLYNKNRDLGLSQLLDQQGKTTTHNLIKYCFITNDIRFTAKLDYRTISRLQERTVRFGGYSINDALKILKYYISHPKYPLVNKEYLPENLDRELINFFKQVNTGDMRELLNNFVIWGRRCKDKLDTKELTEDYFAEIELNEVIQQIKRLDTHLQVLLYSILKATIDLQRIPDYAKKSDYPHQAVIYRYYKNIVRSMKHLNIKELKDRQFKKWLNRLISYKVINTCRVSLGRAKGVITIYLLDDFSEPYFSDVIDYLCRELEIGIKFTYENNIYKDVVNLQRK